MGLVSTMYWLKTCGVDTFASCFLLLHFFLSLLIITQRDVNSKLNGVSINQSKVESLNSPSSNAHYLQNIEALVMKSTYENNLEDNFMLMLTWKI